MALSSTTRMRTPRRSARDALRRRSRGALFAEDGREPEGRPPALDALDADLAAHQLDEALGDGQSQPRAAEPARGRGVHLLEGAEQEPDLVLGNADARVPHLEAGFELVVGFRLQP